MPFYDHECRECGNIWEDFYSARKDPPDTCPSCGMVGKVIRLIPNNISVRVTLGKDEQRQKIKEDADKIYNQISSDTNFAANFEGESKFDQKLEVKKQFESDISNI